MASPVDKNGTGGGATPLALSYFDGTSVDLTAPSHFAGRAFRRWFVDGAPQPASRTVTVTVDQARSACAEYVAIRRAGPPAPGP